MRVYRRRNWTFWKWEPEADVHGECATLVDGDRRVDLVVTFAGDGTYCWDVIDGYTIIAKGIERTKTAARHAAEVAARRALIRVA